MKKLLFFILAIILISIFTVIKSCQKEDKEIINVYVDREMEIFVGKLAKKYEKVDKETEIKINTLKSIEDYDIILTDEDSKIKDELKKKYEVKDFFEDNLVIIGHRKIDNLSQMLTSSIAIPTKISKLVPPSITGSFKTYPNQIFGIIPNNDKNIALPNVTLVATFSK
mgnify:CR=1 FL=1